MIRTSLRYLMSVARHGSIRAASVDLGIAQSAVSRQLQALEHEVGTALFERKPRGVELTEAGELLYAYCLNSTFAAERLYSELDDLRGLRRGRVRLASVESAVSSIVSRAIDAFRKQHPNIIFFVDILTSDRVLDVVRDGDVDFGITLGGELNEDILNDDIDLIYNSSEPLLAAMRPDHPLANRASINVHELANWPVALAPPKSGSRIIFENGCSGAGIVFKPALETNSIEMMHQFALLGTGVTVMVRHAGMLSFLKNDLVAIPIEGERFIGNVSVITLKQRALPLAAERFLLTIQDEFSRLPFPSP